jgi:RNA polymerase sigma factor (TIGR02999 family)
MSEVTQILNAIGDGDRQASSELLPLVYDELRRLAAEKMTHERPGQTLQATALVHEAFLRLVGDADRPQWDNRWHFFAAAAEAMRRITLNRVRDKQRLKRGGRWRRIELDQVDLAQSEHDDDFAELAEALDDLGKDDATAAEVVKLRFFAGMKQREIAAALGLSLRTVEREWAFAQAWLYDRLQSCDRLQSDAIPPKN